ncbi:MAG: hypothetical protein RLP44_20745 [Aggregatilineales bacterium]
MQIFDFSAQSSKPITQYGSQHAVVSHLIHSDGKYFIVCIRVEAGGFLGRHEAHNNQLFCVVQGAGTVSGDDGNFQPITEGQAAFWQAGEFHETRSEQGLTAMVFEGENLQSVEALARL